jgi:phosphoesterase RecJ-like protein
VLNEIQRQFIADAQKILVIQAENPDGDSLGSALALEEIFGDMGKDVVLYCAIEMPKYLRYITGWDRVTNEFDSHADLAIIVDNSSRALMEKALATTGVQHFLESHPTIVFDHHASVVPDLPFPHSNVTSDTAVATGELIYEMAAQNDWSINTQAATNLFISIQADSLGLTTPSTTARSFAVCAQLIELGAQPSAIESARREMMKKAPEILAYKGRLIERIEYFLDDRLALIHVPWEEIEQYSDKYNPTMLVLDEMRLVTGVDVAIGVKTYPDKKLTGKLRVNLPVADKIAGFYGGGGHAFAAGFKIYEDYDKWLSEFVPMVDKVLGEHDNA